MKWFRRRREPEVGHAFLELAQTYALSAYDRQLAFGTVVGDPDWLLDQDRGLLVLDGSLELPAQLIGSYAEQSGTWLWAWANPSVGPSMTVQAAALRDFGRLHSVPELTDAEVAASRFQDGHLMALVASGVLQTDAYFRCPYEGGQAFVLLSLPPNLIRHDEPLLVRASATIRAALTNAPIAVARPGIRQYLDELGIVVSEGESEIRVEGEESSASFVFDQAGRLITLGAELHAGSGTTLPPD